MKITKLSAGLAITALVIGGSVAAALPASATTYTNSDAAGNSLQGGDYLLSSNGQYKLAMQTDGNAVEYGIGNVVLWQTDTDGNPGAYLDPQADGNLVVRSSSGAALWNSGSGQQSATQLTIGTDGNIVMRNGSSAVWDSGTTQQSLLPGTALQAGEALHSGYSPSAYSFDMQSDGNLVERDGSGAAVWSSGTAGNTGAYASFQTDGNFVVRSASGAALWNTKTAGTKPRDIIMQSDGNVVMYETDGSHLWNTHGVGSGSTGTQPAEQTAFNFFVSQSFTQIQSAGIVGNLIQESNVSPTSVEANGVGHGIAQWSEPGRWDTLVSWANSKGLSNTALNTQLQFMMYEFPSYGESALKQETSITGATTSFMNNYEKCGNCIVSHRIADAQSVYNDYATP